MGELVIDRKCITQVTLSTEGLEALVQKALEDDPTYVLDQLSIHNCGSDMYVRSVGVRIEDSMIILEIEDVNH